MARVYVDFNEMLADDIVLLSREDSKTDIDGDPVSFTEGKAVSVYMNDLDPDGNPDNLIADGTSELNPYYRSERQGWGALTKWILKIDSRGIRNESEEIASVALYDTDSR